MLHRSRKRQEALARDEARGVSFWSESFSENARVRIMHAFADSIAQFGVPQAATYAWNLILRDEGLIFLVDPYVAPPDDISNYLMTCQDDMVPTVVEAFANATRSGPNRGPNSAKVFEYSVKKILREYRISFDLIEGTMIEFSSQELHVAVVSPTLHLLSKSHEWGSVEKSYKDALEEISDGKPGDAITDAGAALQECLTLLGCEGNALGPLIKSARKNALFAAHDGPMIDGIDKVLHWVSADRSEMGDAHIASPASIDDAWLIVHVVGAIILRLARGTARNKGNK